MKILPLFLLLFTLTLSRPALAGRSHSTTIDNVIVKTHGVEIYLSTSSTSHSCTTINGQKNAWYLPKTHANFEALYKGFLATKLGGRKTDIVGTGACAGTIEIIDWAYVVQD